MGDSACTADVVGWRDGRIAGLASGRHYQPEYRPAWSHPMTYDPNQQPGHYGPPPQPYGQAYGQQQPVVSGPPAQPYPPQQYGSPPPQYGFVPPPPQPPKKKTSPLAVIGAIFGGLILLCVIGAVVSKGADEGTKTAVAKLTTGPAKKGDTKKPAKDVDDPAGKTFNVAVGSTITVDDGDGNVQEGTLRSVKTFTKGCNSLNVDPKQGMYVVLDVVVVQKKGAGSVNPLDFTFVADDGTSNNALSSAFSGCEEPSLGATDLRAGQKRAGKIGFDVNSKKGSLEWAPGGLGADTVGSWKTS